MDMDTIVKELERLFANQDLQGVRKYVKTLVIVGRCDSVLSQNLLDA